MPDTLFVAPDAPERCKNNPFGYQWFPIPWLDGSSQEAAEASQAVSADLLDRFLDDLLADEGLRPSQMILFGFSQGTMMSLHVAPRRPDPVAGVVGFSGRLLVPERLEAEIRLEPADPPRPRRRRRHRPHRSRCREAGDALTRGGLRDLRPRDARHRPRNRPRRTLAWHSPSCARSSGFPAEERAGRAAR